MKKAYVFPGQGAQFTGMGKSLYESDAQARNLMEKANDILGFRLTDIMFEGSAEDLKQTKVTQPAVFLHSMVSELCLATEKPDMVAGHSLGEFSALVACGALAFEDALRLVSARAEAMQKCCEKTPGTMAAVIGLDAEVIENVCKDVCSENCGMVLAANYNSPLQTVISGETAAVDAACAKLKEAGAKRALPLAVSGAFHSPLMKWAEEELAGAIEKCSFSAPNCPIYQNVSGQAETDPQRIRENLLLQLTSPVRWTQSVERMIQDGATEFTEFGPGNTLAGLISRIGGKELIINEIQ